MCLSILVHHSEVELEQGTFEGYEYAITRNFIGYRCGYIKLEQGHPWCGVEQTLDINAQVHGGVTFSEADLACGKGGDDNGWWLGIDAAHSGDALDPSLLPEGTYIPTIKRATIKTTDYIRNELFELIKQAIDLNQNQDT